MKLIPIITAALLLSGCASTGEYWTRVHEAAPHTKTVIVERPCGRADWAGCNSRATGVIQLWRGLNAAQRWCVESHEKRHLAGWNHYGTHGLLAYDCGNGETL